MPGTVTIQFKDDASILKRRFADFAVFSAEEKTAVSIRDGVLEYLGSELGLEPPEQIFTVYRSPATIANAAYCMSGIPLTNEHVSMDGAPPDTGSIVEDSRVIDQLDEATSSRLAVKNRLKVSDSLLPLIKDKKQLSLGYQADLIPHTTWDFEQVNIIPHHLAAVHAGRCGSLCSFLDRKPTMKDKDMKNKKLNKAFCDEDGAINLEQIVEIATGLPEAIRKVPVDKLQALIPAMLEIMSYAKEQGAVTEEEIKEELVTDETDPAMKAEEAAKAKEEDKASFADAVAKAAMIQSKKLVDEAVKQYGEVVSKARNFVDETYDFSAKTANEIMRDALAIEHGETQFTDAELSTAFKLLKKSSPDYSKFGDSKNESGLSARIKQELGE